MILILQTQPNGITNACNQNKLTLIFTEVYWEIDCESAWSGLFAALSKFFFGMCLILLNLNLHINGLPNFHYGCKSNLFEIWSTTKTKKTDGNWGSGGGEAVNMKITFQWVDWISVCFLCCMCRCFDGDIQSGHGMCATRVCNFIWQKCLFHCRLLFWFWDASPSVGCRISSLLVHKSSILPRTVRPFITKQHFH